MPAAEEARRQRSASPGSTPGPAMHQPPTPASEDTMMRKHSSNELLDLATERVDAAEQLELCGFPEDSIGRPTYRDMARAVEVLSIYHGLYPEWCSAGWGPAAITDGFVADAWHGARDDRVDDSDPENIIELSPFRVPEGGARWTVGVHRGANEGMILTIHRRYDDGSPGVGLQVNVCSLKTTETGRTTWAKLYRIAEEVGARLNGVYAR